MPVADTVTPLFDAAGLRLGRFRCPPSHPRWQAENSIGASAHVVFPERAVTITRASTGPQLGDRNWAVLYEPGQRYRRELVDPAGDECTFVELSDTLYAELLESRDGVRRAFAAGRVLVDDLTWLDYQDLLAGTSGSPAVIEEQLRHVLLQVLARPAPAPDADLPIGPGTTRLPAPPERSSTAEGLNSADEPLADVGLAGSASRTVATDWRVHDACRVLASHLDQRVTLADVAESVGLSRYHFARLFRAATGLTVHAYRQRLQLRAAFATCATTPYRTLSEVAMAAGYASHSHMTSSFRQSLRMSPSTVRVRYGRDAGAAGRGEPTLIG